MIAVKIAILGAAIGLEPGGKKFCYHGFAVFPSAQRKRSEMRFGRLRLTQNDRFQRASSRKVELLRV